MKKYILSATLLLGACYVSAQSVTAEPYRVERFSNAKITNVRSETSGGNITVIGEAAASPKVEIFITGNDGRKPITGDEIKQRLQDYELNVSVSGSTIVATARPLRKQDRNFDWKKALNISFKIYVPKTVSTELETSGGNIKLSDLAGTQEFTTSGGNLTLDRLSGKLHGRTSGGNINIKDSKDNIDLTTSGGNIDAENCNGTLALETSGGNLALTELKGTIRANTSGGNIHGDMINGDLSTHTSGGSITLKDMSGGVDASTSGGNITVAMTDVTRPVKLTNSGGDIQLKLPKSKGLDLRVSAENIRTESLGNFKGTQDRERIEGSLNGGGTSVRVNAGSGNVRLILQ
jgi:DUF4097 and DUF4098 domain-containing protein YvlB